MLQVTGNEMLCYLAHGVNCDVVAQEGPLVRRGQNNVACQATIHKVLGITNDVLRPRNSKMY